MARPPSRHRLRSSSPSPRSNALLPPNENARSRKRRAPLCLLDSSESDRFIPLFHGSFQSWWWWNCACARVHWKLARRQLAAQRRDKNPGMMRSIASLVSLSGGILVIPVAGGVTFGSKSLSYLFYLSTNNIFFFLKSKSKPDKSGLPKNYLQYPSHQIFGHIHRVLNLVEKIINYTV